VVAEDVPIVDLGELPVIQVRMWRALLDLSEHLPGQWTLVGGQMVALHAAERGAAMGRTTTDVDALLDIRADGCLFARADLVLRQELGFSSEVGLGGTQHRWSKDGVQIDILIPEVSRSLAESRSALGGVAIQSPGSNQALSRSRPVEVRVGGRSGLVERPSILGAIISKAAAFAIPKDPARGRHASDIAVLLGMARAKDRIYDDLTSSDLRYLRRMADRFSVADALKMDQRGQSRVRQYLDAALDTPPASS
jgi:hypothetical protein